MLAIYPIVSLYGHNIAEVPAEQAAVPAAISFVFAACFTALLWLAFRDIRKAGLITTVFVALFFSYGHAVEALGGKALGSAEPETYVAALWLFLFLSALIAVGRTRRDLSAGTSILNVMGSVALIMALVPVLTYRPPVAESPGEDKAAGKPEIENTVTKGPKPDIYYIILDSYPTNATLKKVFGYDNSPFTDALEDKGFYVAEKSRGNYVLTYLSLASSLNMKYINYLAEKGKVGKWFSTVPYRMVSDNEAARFLRARGYKFVHINSGWSGTARNPSADIQIDTGDANEFGMMLVETSMLRLIEPYIGFIGADEIRRRKTIFLETANIPYLREPTFTFAHLLLPHPPYFFEADGTPIVQEKYSWGGHVWAERAKYRDQLIYTNKMVEETIGKILERSDTPPIIIIQGDHGPASSFYVDGNPLWLNPTDKQLDERTGILNAYYFGGRKNKYFRADISPVNTFRVIFNSYFSAEYPLLKDETWFSNYNDAYKFSNVTKRLKRAKRPAEK